jgi:hypothetical protein
MYRWNMARLYEKCCPPPLLQNFSGPNTTEGFGGASADFLECRPCYDARARSEENGQSQERPLFLYVDRIVGAEAEKPGGIWCVFFQDQVFLHKELVLPLFALLRPLCKTQYNS